MRPREIALLLLLAGSAAGAQPAAPPRCSPVARLYVAPMGQPFRVGPDGADPMGAWFAAADADRDGRVTLAEFVDDARRFYPALDRNADGEIDPQELLAYESEVAPEIRLYQRGGAGSGGGRGRRGRDKRDYGDRELGAGRFSQLNVPQPVASADADFNRGVTAAEYAAAAAERFRQLLPSGADALTLATMKQTPAQAEAAECAAELARQARKGRKR